MELTLNSAVLGVQLSGIRRFTFLVRDTPGACALTIGEPDLNTPDVIKDAAKAALDDNDTHYPPGNGYPYMLEAISAFEAKAHGLHYSPDEIILTIGATESLFLSLSTVLNPGDEVIIPTPAFSLYESITQLCRGVPVALPTEKNHFQIDPEQLKAAITPRTKAVILTSPNNPTGCIYTRETLNAIHEILKDKPIFVLCDDVYRTLVYTGEYHSFSEYQDMRDRIIVIQSFSKPYAMTGWRLGYCLADAPIRDRMQIFHQYSVVSAPSFVQRACVAALGSDTHGVVEIFRKRKEYVYRRLKDMGLEVQEPEGAFYMFINIRKYGMDSLTFCEKMLREGLVGLIPGVYFGTEGYMRLSYCYSDADLKEGLDRVERFLQTL
ncbi:pyridoxal phosphate-dependent aminotransferase [Oscillibacter sp.]|uniref:pyridoxal phosphate-dependent aminotransferase n=1 Tax=Oscillibacter sp. TaxID=1945593 RepID=UPI00262DF9B8|nr:pyridoxal phosphate-dependent aminotransferase [Oscillibacter sp.]MDD3346657.1 pyridoxal phosphate-dependent aminotransferase [Oscillibacter sp.]